jgi:hypothetical protein
MPSGRGRKKRTGRATPAPRVHVKVALADTDLRAAADLIKPAVLYADGVTVYSPAASMLTAIADVSRLRNPREQMSLIVSLVREVPQLREQLGVSDDLVEQMVAFLAVDRRVVNLVARAHGADAQVTEFYRLIDDFGGLWAERLPEAVENAKAALGGAELITALDRGAIKVADLLGGIATPMIAESLRLAAGERSAEPLDDLVNTFVARLVELVTEPRTFPLFDAQSSGLLRALEGATRNAARKTMPRAVEVATAATFMGYLPSFSSMPMDEVIDLRRELEVPLIRFRAAVARLSRDFESRPIDETFDAEVEDAWRREIAPALADIREALAEHGLLREVASIALGDPRRLILEAGGVVAAAYGDVLSLSGLLTAGTALGVPALDVLGRSLKERGQGRRKVRGSAFYFLHRVGDVAQRSR